MNTAQKLARSGGPALGEAMKFVTICRALDPQNDYPHIGDLQWWCRDGSLDDQQNWHFWYQENGEALALGIIAGDEIVCLLHPDFRTHERYLYGTPVGSAARKRACWASRARTSMRYRNKPGV